MSYSNRGTGAGAEAPSPQDVLWLQRTVGNHQTTSLLRGHEQAASTAVSQIEGRRGVKANPSPVATRPASRVPRTERRMVQRHASWEHRLLGDVDPATLQVVTRANEFANRPYETREVQAGTGEALGEQNDQASHALTQQLQLLRAWQTRPPSPGTTEWNGVQLVTIRLDDGDEVVCSRGEMNGLADYYGSLAQLKRGRKTTLERILQTVRQQSFTRIRAVLRGIDPGAAASITNPGFGGASHFTEGKAADLEMNAITADQRNQRSETYLANVARNACHFAPQSWFSWKNYHLQARGIAQQAWEARQKAEEENNESLRRVAENLANEAVVTNGFGDHYLQDSFAAGHLINKTLVMQWFVEWLGSQNLVERMAGTSAGSRWISNWDQVRRMTHDVQPELAGLDLYDKPSDGQATDPQAAENQATRAERIARTGLQGTGDELDTAYDDYHAFLNSAAVQAAAGALHDHFCQEGLEVYAGDLSIGYIFGDDEMISGGTGVEFSAETAQMSQKAIDDMNEGREPVAADEIMKRFPDHVQIRGRRMSLEEWHTGGVLREFCETTIFPNVPYRVAGRLPLAPFGVSQDVWGGSGPAQMGRVRNLLLEVARRARQVRALAARARDRVASGARDLRDRVVSGARGARDRVVSGARDLRDRVMSGARGARDRAVSGAKSAYGRLRSGTSEALDTVTSGASSAWERVTGRTHRLLDPVREQVEEMSGEDRDIQPSDGSSGSALIDAFENLRMTIDAAKESTTEGLPDVPEVSQSALDELEGTGEEAEPVDAGAGERHDGPF